mgnify:FL=1
MINIKINFRPQQATNFLKRLMRRNKSARFTALRNVAQKQQSTILARTDKGIGVNGAFKRYTDDYRDFKRGIGQSGRPNLQVSNFMLSNMQVKGNSNIATIFFRNQKAKELASFNDKTRPFFSVTNKEEKDIHRIFAQQFFRHLKI